MKKLLVLLTVILTLGLMGCESNPAPSVYDDTLLQEQITDINLQLDDLENYNDDELQVKYGDLQTALDLFIDSYVEYDDRDIQIELSELDLEIQAVMERIDNLIIMTGLNGNVSIYENTVATGLFMSAIQLKDTFDKSKAPAYLLDDNEEYVTQQALGILLKEKYFNDTTTGIGGNDIDRYTMGSKAFFGYLFISEMTDEELLARTVLMIEELRLYEFYMLSCPELVIDIHRMTNYDNHMSITIPLVVVINDFFEITLDGIYDGDYEMRLETYGSDIDYELAQQYYDEFVLNETFIGYVLNYE